jgi:hypothetical protein
MLSRFVAFELCGLDLVADDLIFVHQVVCDSHIGHQFGDKHLKLYVLVVLPTLVLFIERKGHLEVKEVIETSYNNHVWLSYSLTLDLAGSFASVRLGIPTSYKVIDQLVAAGF